MVKDVEIVHRAGFGRTSDGPVDADTPMAIGSVSKSFTACAVLELVDAGRLALDDPATAR